MWVGENKRYVHIFYIQEVDDARDDFVAMSDN